MLFKFRKIYVKGLTRLIDPESFNFTVISPLVNKVFKPYLNFFSRLRLMWDEFDVICCLPACEFEQFQKHLEHVVNLLKLFRFLNVLVDSYSTIQSNMLMREKLHSLDHAYSILIQQENHRRLFENSMVNVGKQPRTPRRNLFCDFCKNKGYTINCCFEKHGYPTG